MCSLIFEDNDSCDNKTQWILVILDLFKDLMNFLDSWLFDVVLHKIFNKNVE